MDADGDRRADYCRVVGSVNGESSHVACTRSEGTGFGATTLSPVIDWGYDTGRSWAGEAFPAPAQPAAQAPAASGTGGGPATTQPPAKTTPTSRTIRFRLATSRKASILRSGIRGRLLGIASRTCRVTALSGTRRLGSTTARRSGRSAPFRVVLTRAGRRLVRRGATKTLRLRATCGAVGATRRFRLT